MFSLLLGINAQSQEVLPVYSDYLTDNLYLLHPSMAGASTRNKIRLTARQQWFEVEDAPSLQTLSAHLRWNEKIGLGTILFNDSNGNFSRKGIYGTFAYHLQFSRDGLELNQLSFGISGGIIQHRLDQSSFIDYDPLITSAQRSEFYANMSIGASYYFKNIFAHLTLKNLLTVKRDLFLSSSVPQNQRIYLFSTGYVIETRRRDWSYEPSILIQYREETKEQLVDLNIKAYREFGNGRLFGGLSYRRNLLGVDTDSVKKTRTQNLQYLTPFLGLEYKDFLFAYTYSQQINSITFSNNGFHQITLGFNFGKNPKHYDCYCPGVN